MRILHVDSSILYTGSASREITRAVVDHFKGLDASVEVTYRDLCASPLAPLSLVTLPTAHRLSNAPTTDDERRNKAESDGALAEFLAADVVVIGAPMYDLTIPSLLKSWVERVCVAGTTFKYGPDGPVGLLGDKQVVVVASRGGDYSPGSPDVGLDHAESYLRSLLVFLGVADLEVIVVEGLGFNEESRKRALEGAHQRARSLLLKKAR